MLKGVLGPLEVQMERNNMLKPKKKNHKVFKPLPKDAVDYIAQSICEVEDDKILKDLSLLGRENYVSTKMEDLSPIAPEIEQEIRDLYNLHPELKTGSKPVINVTPAYKYTQGTLEFDPKEDWIQTYSGKRFTPLKPNPEAIVIQDIAHSLSMQCRFNGHCREFYSVAQHSVLVSYICDSQDALWGLLHDASETFLADFPTPLKHSGKFDNYSEYERQMQMAICQRFALPFEEPTSVKKADKVLLSTEARDLMVSLRDDWFQPTEPLPFKIIPLSPKEAKELFLKRFFELIGSSQSYERYLYLEGQGLI